MWFEMIYQTCLWQEKTNAHTTLQLIQDISRDSTIILILCFISKFFSKLYFSCFPCWCEQPPAAGSWPACLVEQMIFRSPFLFPSQDFGWVVFSLKRAAQSQKAPPKPVPVQRASNDVKISLEPPTCGFVTIYFQLDKSVYVVTHPSQQVAAACACAAHIPPSEFPQL